MGYELHITRKRYYWDDGSDDISEAEWAAIIGSDPELEPYPGIGPHGARWNGKSEYPDPWFNWFEGRISTKNPDEPIILKMLKIAKELGAKVQGDDGEVYTSPSDYYYEDESVDYEPDHPDERIAIEPPPFKVGDIVLDQGYEAKVIKLNPKANNGAGEIQIQFDNGVIQKRLFLAHVLQKKMDT